jgi:hypothetical protein
MLGFRLHGIASALVVLLLKLIRDTIVFLTRHHERWPAKGQRWMRIDLPGVDGLAW